MRKAAAIGLLSSLGLVQGLVAGNQRLTVRVSPTVAVAPAALTVRAFVEPDEANRFLSIVVSSARYERTSEVPLDGKESQMNLLELRDVPARPLRDHRDAGRLGGPAGEGDADGEGHALAGAFRIDLTTDR